MENFPKSIRNYLPRHKAFQSAVHIFFSVVLSIFHFFKMIEISKTKSQYSPITMKKGVFRLNHQTDKPKKTVAVVHNKYFNYFLLQVFVLPYFLEKLIFIIFCLILRFKKGLVYDFSNIILPLISQTWLQQVQWQKMICTDPHSTCFFVTICTSQWGRIFFVIPI